MDKQVLRELREFVKDRRVDMSLFYPGTPEELLGDCGTAGCFAGYLIAMTPSQWPVAFGHEWETGSQVAQLSGDQSGFLFREFSHIPRKYRTNRWCDEEEARMRLDVLIDAEEWDDYNTLYSRLVAIDEQKQSNVVIDEALAYA